MKRSVLIIFTCVLLIAVGASFLIVSHKPKPDWSKLIVKNPDDVPLATIDELEQVANRHLREIGVKKPERIIRIEKENLGFTLFLASHPEAWRGHLLTLLPKSNDWSIIGFGNWTE